ncbi:MAG: NAD+ synthase [Bacteroidetes bacterium]|nr:NAD+ synthase [Bacteroidota bacterium]
MKIAIAQLNPHIGNFERNISAITDKIKEAKEKNADLVIFPELSVPGYPPLDLLEHKSFINHCKQAVIEIAKQCENIAAIVGSPSLNPAKTGKNLLNTAYLLSEGQIIFTVNKTLLPTYDIFDEYRYFESNTKFSVVNFKGKKIAITICEDLWDQLPSESDFGRNSIYNISPIKELSLQNPDFIINIAASPFVYSRIETKRNFFTSQAKKFKTPIIYVNQVGAQTELIFEGGSLVVNQEGKIIERLKYFEEDFRIIDSEKIETVTPLPIIKDNITKNIYYALVMGLRDYFHKMNFGKAILGLSGGIDSAVSLAIASEALGKKNIKAILLPSRYSSEHSITDAVSLADNLQIDYNIVPIEQMFKDFKQSLEPLFRGLPDNTTEENIQARIRGVLLMAISNKFGHILLNTSNKSEAAVGYGTLYGDMAGGLSVLGDVYKSEVYRLAHFINRNKEIIPENTILKPPSAELKQNQKDTDSLPDYEILDDILFLYIEKQMSPDEITKKGFDNKLVRKIIHLVNINEYKRYQAPPILRISSKAFGAGRRMPLVARYDE